MSRRLNLASAVILLLAPLPAFAQVKLSAINNGGAINTSTDQCVAVRSGTTDELVTLAASAGTDTTSASNISSGSLALARITALGANQLLGSLTAVSPSGQSVPSCSAAGNALKWTSGTGFGCATGFLTANQTITLSGDTTGSGTTAITTSTVKVNGGAVPASATAVATNSSNQFIAATYQGNGSKLQLSSGATTLNDCVKFDSAGNTVDAGAACGSGGGGGDTITSPNSTITIGGTSSNTTLDVTQLTSNTITNGDWCTSNGSIINCTSAVPVTSWTGDTVLHNNSGSTGAVTETLANQNANVILAGPATGSAATPTFRALTTADVPAVHGATIATVALTSYNGL